jgi:hypothetical protein
MKKLLMALAVICTPFFTQKSLVFASPITEMEGEILDWGLGKNDLLTLGRARTIFADNTHLAPELVTAFAGLQIDPTTIGVASGCCTIVDNIPFPTIYFTFDVVSQGLGKQITEPGFPILGGDASFNFLKIQALVPAIFCFDKCGHLIIQGDEQLVQNRTSLDLSEWDTGSFFSIDITANPSVNFLATILNGTGAASGNLPSNHFFIEAISDTILLPLTLVPEPTSLVLLTTALFGFSFLCHKILRY